LGTGVQILYQWYTQRRLPEQAAGGSQFLGYLFPLVMALLFLSFPAGLWLYWTFTTLVQFGQQMVIDWEMAREEARAGAGDGGKAS
jgi:membrane protein insertase Oxa1/YidC/SpoIIIJ